MAIELSGIYAAIVTPFDPSGHPARQQLTALLRHLERRGCDGVLLAGTTGEGPSLSVSERIDLFKAAFHADTSLRLLAGTGAASLEDAVTLTRAAFDLGCSAAVLAPPFFYMGPSQEGLYAFYTEVIRRAVPADGSVLLYHNPPVIGIPLETELVHRLRDDFPEQVVGIKDSGQDWQYTLDLIRSLPGFQVLVGDDRRLAQTLAAGGAGAITGLSNAFPDLLQDVRQAHRQHASTDEAQARLDKAHRQLDGLPRIPAIKTLLRIGGIIENDAVRPPLRPLTQQEMEKLQERFHLNLGYY